MCPGVNLFLNERLNRHSFWEFSALFFRRPVNIHSYRCQSVLSWVLSIWHPGGEPRRSIQRHAIQHPHPQLCVSLTFQRPHRPEFKPFPLSVLEVQSCPTTSGFYFRFAVHTLPNYFNFLQQCCCCWTNLVENHLCAQDDGVWYPDSLLPILQWMGDFAQDKLGDGRTFNPFVDVAESVIVDHFTEQMPGTTNEKKALHPRQCRINSSDNFRAVLMRSPLIRSD